ncbi:MAG: hypothetical protein U0807_15995 [Candidatus Binatia bacterium]
MALTIDPRIVRGMTRQLEQWRAALAAGGGRAGWKIGLNAPATQRALGIAHSVVGHLTVARCLMPGVAHSLAGGTRVLVEPEVAVVIAGPVPPDADDARIRAAIAGLAPAIEIVDLDGPVDDVERIVAGNVFHRGVLLGRDDPTRAGGALAGITVTVTQGERTVGPFDAAVVLGDLVPIVRLVAVTLAACGEALTVGDRIITGALTAMPVAPGDIVDADFGPLGTVGLRFAE